MADKISKVLDRLLKKLHARQEADKEQLKTTVTELEKETLDPDDIAFKLIYRFAVMGKINKEKGSGKNKTDSNPPNGSLPQPSSSTSTGYHSGSSVGSQSRRNQRNNTKTSRKRRRTTKFRKTPLDTIFEECEDELMDEEEEKSEEKNDADGIELTEEQKRDLDVDIVMSQYQSQYTGNVDKGSSEENQKLLYLELCQAVRELDKQIDADKKDDEDEMSIICKVKKMKV